MTKKIFSPLSFVAFFESGIWDPGSGMGKNQDPGSEINIPDPQHCILLTNLISMSSLFLPIAYTSTTTFCKKVNGMRKTLYNLGIINVIPNLDWTLLTDFAYCLCQ
jgi:hypothetical protein